MSSLNKMYDKFNAINKYLFKKDKLSLKEKYVFELTAFAISLIYENKIKMNLSITKRELSKNVIEIIALISYLEDNPEFEKEVDLYTKKTERYLYLKYKNKIKDSFYHFNVDESKEVDNNASIKIDMNELIKKYHNELLNYYELLIYNKEINDLTLNTTLLMTIYIISQKMYPNLEAKYKESLEYAESFLINHPLSQRYMIYLRSEFDLLKRILNYRDKFIEIGNMLISFSIDKLYLNSETFESKFTTLINYLREFYFDIINSDDDSVYSFIDSIDNDEINKDYIKLIYDESLNLNHRLGYSVTSNIDVYQEYSIAIRFVDLAISELIKIVGDADIYNDFINIVDSKNTFDYENQYLVDKKE